MCIYIYIHHLPSDIAVDSHEFSSQPSRHIPPVVSPWTPWTPATRSSSLSSSLGWSAAAGGRGLADAGLGPGMNQVNPGAQVGFHGV